MKSAVKSQGDWQPDWQLGGQYMIGGTLALMILCIRVLSIHVIACAGMSEFH